MLYAAVGDEAGVPLTRPLLMSTSNVCACTWRIAVLRSAGLSRMHTAQRWLPETSSTSIANGL